MSHFYVLAADLNYMLRMNAYQGMQLTKQERIKAIVQKYFKEGEGKDIEANDIILFALFSLANDVFRVSVRGRADILVKIYHAALPEFTDNELQTQLVNHLAGEKVYPQVLYCCKDYRIQHFLQSIPIQRSTFGKEKLLKVAKQMAEYSCKFKSFVFQYNQTHKIRPKFMLNELQQTFWKIQGEKSKECPDLVKECEGYIGNVFGKKEIMDRLNLLLKDTQMVLSHNDCHLGNFLDDGARLYILDHEFSQFNYIGFDLGNFFNQWATDYGHQFQIREELELPEPIKQEMIKVFFSTLRKCYDFSQQWSDWVRYVNIGRVLSHLFWMTVGLKQINDERIEFSMVKYVKRRQEQFLLWMGRLELI